MLYATLQERTIFKDLAFFLISELNWFAFLFLNSVLFAHVLYYSAATNFLKHFTKFKINRGGGGEEGHLLASSRILSSFAIGKFDSIKLDIRDSLPFLFLFFFSSCLLFLCFEASPNSSFDIKLWSR